MSTTRLYLERANTILKLLEAEKILSSNQSNQIEFNFSLKLIRQLAFDFANSQKIIAPQLTACVAITLLGFGLCQELVQRFILEYVIEYREKDISLICLSNLSNPEKSHALVHIGPINVPEQLFVGKGGAIPIANPKKINQPLMEFVSANSNGCLVDPLLNCAGISKDEIGPLVKYCESESIMHLVGVKSYLDTPKFVENAIFIKNNALEVSKKVLEEIKIEKTTFNLENRFFKNTNSTETKIGKVYKEMGLVKISEKTKKEILNYKVK